MFVSSFFTIPQCLGNLAVSSPPTLDLGWPYPRNRALPQKGSPSRREMEMHLAAWCPSWAGHCQGLQPTPGRATMGTQEHSGPGKTLARTALIQVLYKVRATVTQLMPSSQIPHSQAPRAPGTHPGSIPNILLLLTCAIGNTFNPEPGMSPSISPQHLPTEGDLSTPQPNWELWLLTTATGSPDTFRSHLLMKLQTHPPDGKSCWPGNRSWPDPRS